MVPARLFGKALGGGGAALTPFMHFMAEIEVDDVGMFGLGAEPRWCAGGVRLNICEGTRVAVGPL
jgi:hypothetical protein